jgi:hypothetical protein
VVHCARPCSSPLVIHTSSALRCPDVPGWISRIAGGPLHLVFAVFMLNHVLDDVAWALTAVVFAAAAITWKVDTQSAD